MIDKRSIVLLGVLLAVVAGVAYYFYFYEPYTNSIQSLETALEEKQKKLSELNIKLATERMLDDEILERTETINEASRKIFVDLNQEESLQILTKLNRKGLIFDTIVFSERVEESEAKYVEQSLEFSASYHDIMDLLRKLRKHEKKISIVDARLTISETDFEYALANLDSPDQTLSMNGASTDSENDNSSDDTSGERSGEEDSEEEEGPTEAKTPGDTIRTEMILRFRSLPSLAKMGVKQLNLIKDIKSGRALAKGPFGKYEAFIRKAIEEKRKNEEMAQNNTASPIIPNITPPATTFDYANYKPRALVTDFEEGSFFFVGSDTSIGGSVSRSKTRKNGGYSAELSFDFLTPKIYNAAYLVFGNSQLKLYTQPESIVLQAYAYEASDHAIGLILLDAAGREHRVSLANKVDWTDWKELLVKLPDSISYPCVIQRLYVEGVGFEQKLNGKYLFDMMEVEYPAPGTTDKLPGQTSGNN